MRSALQVLSLVAVVSLGAPHAFAQPAPLPKPAPTGPTAQADAKTAPAADPSASADAPKTDSPPKPPTIEVEDPLLAPVAAAPHTLNNFQEVLKLLTNESLTLKIAQQDIERAKGQKRVAIASLLPTVNASLTATLQPVQEVDCLPGSSPTCGFTGRTLTPTSTQAQAGLTEILSVRSWYAIGTADKSIDASKLRAEDARRTAIAAAAGAIVAVVTAERVAELNRVGLRAALQRLELTKRRKRLGSGTDLDIVRAEQDAASSRSQLVSGDETLRKARESLGQLFGKSDAYGVPVTFTLNDIEPALKSACKPTKAEDRTDVLAAKADLEVAKRGVTDIKLGYLPSLRLSSTFSFNSSDSRRTDENNVLVDEWTNQRLSWGIGATLDIPIWDGGARYGQEKTANANVEQARLRLEQATMTASVEATQAQRAVTVAEQARAVSEQARNLARETERLSQIAFASGAGTSLDLIDSGRVLRQAELDLALKELEVVRAKIAALLALSACNV